MDKGDLAPDFTLADEQGTLRTLSEFLTSGPVVLFFYPAAMTTGCTEESCHFRDLTAEFAAVEAQRIGISSDPPARQHRFASTYGFDFPLLSDPDGAVATLFGVRRGFGVFGRFGLPGRLGPLLTRRQTFVLDIDRTVLGVIKSELRMNVHADQALEMLRARKAI